MNRILDAVSPPGKLCQTVKQSEMKKSTRTEVIIESETTIVLRRRDPLCAWCAHCRCETLMLTPEMAESLAGVTTDVIYQRLEAGSIHSIELAGGVVLVCGRSVSSSNDN